MEFYSVITKNEAKLFEGKWIQLKDIMLSEVTRLRKAKVTCLLSYVGDRHNTNTRNIIKTRLC
jgi:hypothetical protein